MSDLSTVVISLIGSFAISFFVAKYYGERWVETRRSKMDHSVRLKDDFFTPWLKAIGENNDYCKFDSIYSKEISKMIPLQVREPDNLQFYEEAMSHLKDYKQLLNDWEKLKQTTEKLNEQLSIFFEEIRIQIKKEIDMPYYCSGYPGDEPDAYLCPDTFTRAVYEEVRYRLETGRKQHYGIPIIQPTSVFGKMFYPIGWSYYSIARSPDEELMKKAIKLFTQFIENKNHWEMIKTLIGKKEASYDKELETVQEEIGDLIKSIELGNIIKGNCQYCP